jgi:hypothetical protein
MASQEFLPDDLPLASTGCHFTRQKCDKVDAFDQASFARREKSKRLRDRIDEVRR